MLIVRSRHAGIYFALDVHHLWRGVVQFVGKGGR